MCISLVSDIPDHLILRSVVDVVDCHSNLHGPHTGSEVPRGLTQHLRQVETDLAAELRELRAIESLEIRRGVDMSEERIAVVFLSTHSRNIILGANIPILPLSLCLRPRSHG